MSLGAKEKENLFIIIVKYFFCLSFHSSANVKQSSNLILDEYIVGY